MKPDHRFQDLPKAFWANVRAISQVVGYTASGKSKGRIKIPDLAEMCAALSDTGLECTHIVKNCQPTPIGKLLHDYFHYRAETLNSYVEPRLMDANRARDTFQKLRAELNPGCPLPMNKQKGAKKASAFLTGIVNMLIETNAAGLPCDFEPRKLTTVTRNGELLRTFARWVDGAFPSTVNPVAVWEIKEYYYTTTFGSRVADGVYESLLDGMEIEELREHEGIDIKHYLIVDAHYTWWECGRSYLCRLMDMLHMGYVDEILFGYETVERLPEIVKEWVVAAQARQDQ